MLRRLLLAVLALLTVAPSAMASDITEFPLHGSGPLGLTAGPDGNLWVAEAASGKVARVTPAGRATEFPLPTPRAEPSDVVVGPDGNLWFTLAAVGKVAKVTPAGTVSEIALPGAVPGPSLSGDTSRTPLLGGIAVGPDGNLWVTEPVANKIASVSTAGVVTEYPAPGTTSTTRAQPGSIAAGSDGALWFVEESGSRGIGRITTAGAVTEFPLSPNVLARKITAGPDGALWLTDFYGALRRITTAGAVTTVPLPGFGNSGPNGAVVTGGPEGIVTGPDGNLWVTERRGDRIARVSPSGQVSEFALQRPAAEPTGIAVGPDGAIWFGEFAAARLGRIPTTAVADPIPPKLALKARVSPRRPTKRTRLKLSFVVPPYQPPPPPQLPTDDPEGSPDGPSYYDVETARTPPKRHCFGSYGFSPPSQKYSDNKIVPGLDQPGRRVTVRLKPQPRWCTGKLAIDISIVYYTAPGPGSDLIPLEDLGSLTTRIR